jgi:FG-GAP-like repeat/Secretion system C-terminal sorting domain
MKPRLLTLQLLLAFVLTQAQTTKYQVTSIPVQKNGTWMRDPWVGGMDCPQFSMGDINQDGIQDLFVFDRTGNRIFTYLGNGGAPDTMFTYAPQYERLFPTWITNWSMLRDYNHDGIPDLFTWVGPGCLVMKGSFNNGILRLDTVSPFLRYRAVNGGNGQVNNPNVPVLSLDIPGIMDVNGDGDLDILAYDIYGGLVGYYENQTVEHGSTGAYAYDSLKYRLITTCWGGFAQNTGSVAGNSITLHIDSGDCTYSDLNDTIYAPPVPGGGSIERHSGNSLFPVVDPVTHSVDLLNGNVGFNDLMFLRNCADRTNPYGDMCVWDSIFPPLPCTNQILMYQYPAAYGIPISNDSLQDLLISPNVIPAYYYSGGNARNVNNVLWYKNLNDTTCWYDFQNDSFLVHHMLDFGTNSRGVFYDFDGDGLTDIIVGSYGYFDPTFLPSTYRSTLAYYRNVGTATQPAFQQVTLDYDSFSNYHLMALSPAFGDLDGDGKPDLVMGDQSGYLYFCKNMATGAGSSYPVITQQHFDTIQVTGYAAPFIYDINGDSLNDLLVGSDNGYIYYYQNTGTKTSPYFNHYATDSFGYVNICSYGSLDGCFAQPFVMKDSAGNLLLYVGSEGGLIYKYLINPDSIARGSFRLLDSNVIGRAIGANATVSIADINNDGKMEYLLGTSTGGLVMYSDSDWNPGTTLGIYNIPANQGRLNIYPNPAHDYFVCTADDGGFINPRLDIYNVAGQQVNAGVQFNNNQVVVNTQQLSDGFYLIRITDAGKSYPGKVLVAR